VNAWAHHILHAEQISFSFLPPKTVTFNLSAFYFWVEKDLLTFGVILFFGTTLVFSAISGTENIQSK